MDPRIDRLGCASCLAAFGSIVLFVLPLIVSRYNFSDNNVGSGLLWGITLSLFGLVQGIRGVLAPRFTSSRHVLSIIGCVANCAFLVLQILGIYIGAASIML